MKVNPNIKRIEHKHGTGKIQKLPNVISAMHIQRKNKDGGTDHVVRVRFKKEGKVEESNFIVKGHPDTMSFGDYNYIINTINSFNGQKGD